MGSQGGEDWRQGGKVAADGPSEVADCGAGQAVQPHILT